MRTLTKKLKLTKAQYLILKDFCHYSNNLYNYSLYICNAYYKETGKYIGLKELYHTVKNNENYRLLPAQVAKEVIRLLDKNYRSFFSLLNRKHKGQYNGNVNPPNYRKKGSLYHVVYGYQSIYVKEKSISLYNSKEYQKQTNTKTKLEFKFYYDKIDKIKQVIIKPYNDGQYFKMFIQYEEKKEKRNYDLDKDKYMGIDLGINNLASCFIPTGPSLLVNGKPLKSYNRWYNKKVAKLKSELKLKQNKNWSNQLQNLADKRHNWIDNYFNQAVSQIIGYCLTNSVGNIIIGYNKTWKQKSNIGKVNNQKFQAIPHLKFKQKLENKCNEFGITFQFTEESYTSKANFLNGDAMKKDTKFTGKRIKRGLYKLDNGKLINSDINGAANIIRKVIPDVHKNQGIVGLMLNPLKLNIL